MLQENSTWIGGSKEERGGEGGGVRHPTRFRVCLGTLHAPGCCAFEITCHWIGILDKVHPSIIVSIDVLDIRYNPK